MKTSVQYIVAALVFGAPLLGCADWDNPTALSELDPEVEFELDVAQVETFQKVEIHVHVTEGGAQLQLRQAELEITRPNGDAIRIVEAEPEGDGYAAHLMFFVPGEHHLHFSGMPERHRLMREMGEHEIHVERLHRVIGPYWVELELDPAPVLERMEAHVHVFVFELLAGATPGDPVGNLDLELEVHDTEGAETSLEVIAEEFGEYEAEYGFKEAGVYEVHVTIQVDGEQVDGEFHIPVLAFVDDGARDNDEHADDDSGGHGHGH